MFKSDHQAKPDYQELAEFRYQIRRFLRLSEQAARAAGLEPQQHQMLLALKGLPEGKKATIGVLAERLQIQHHSAVELIDRLAGRKLIRRYRSRVDRRQVFVRLTASGERVLRELSLYHLQELQSVGASLGTILNELISNTRHSGGGESLPKELQAKEELPERKKMGEN